AREMLGTAYLFEPPAEVPAEVRQVVAQVKEQVAPEPVVAAPAPAAEKPSRWSIWGRAQTTFPLLGGVGAVPVIDLSLAAECAVPGHFDAAAGVGGRYGALTAPAASGAFFFSGRAQAVLYRGFNWGPLSAGPFLAAELSYASFRAPGQAAVQAWVPAFQAGV